MPKGDIHKEKQGADRRARLAAEAARGCQMDVRRVTDRTLLSLSGEFDATCVIRYERLFREAADEGIEELLVVDMRGVTFIDSTGLALLLRTEAASRQDGFELEIMRSPAPAVRSALEASGLERVLPFIDEE